jgi:hypothetical protein
MSKGKDAPKPYLGYIVYGPIFHKKEKRNMVVLYPKPGTSLRRSSTSYARYLVSIKLGRKLTQDEEVDHIDDNSMNDSIKNLKLITPENNRKKAAMKQSSAMLELKCPHCQKTFTRERRQTHLAKSGLFTACSRHCAGKVHAALQYRLTSKSILNGNIIKEFRIKIST